MRSFALIAGLLLVPAAAGASPTFPQEIQTTLDMGCKPDCTTCHTRPEGGYGTARKPFGLAMQSEGLMAKSPNLIAGALQKLEASRSDVDKDGVPDVEELRNQEDPNSDAALVCFTDPPEDSGCAVSRAPALQGVSGNTNWAVLIAVGIAARVVVRKRGRKRRGVLDFRGGPSAPRARASRAPPPRMREYAPPAGGRRQ